MKLAAIVVLAVTIVTASSVVFVNARSAQTIDVRPCGASRTQDQQQYAGHLTWTSPKAPMAQTTNPNKPYAVLERLWMCGFLEFKQRSVRGVGSSVRICRVSETLGTGGAHLIDRHATMTCSLAWPLEF